MYCETGFGGRRVKGGGGAAAAGGAAEEVPQEEVKSTVDLKLAGFDSKGLPITRPAISVNAIGTGPKLKNKNQSDEDFALQAQNVPLERGASPEEICAALDFIIDAQAMTGQMIALDGGQHLSWRTPDVVDARE